MHHSFDLENFVVPDVNDGEWKTMEVKFAIIAPNDAPPFRFDHYAAQRAFKLINEVIAQARLPFFIPQRTSFQLLIGFRMADDVHGAWRECLERFLPQGGR